MRQLIVTCPVEYEEQVIEALQEICRLKNITKSTDGGASRIICYVAAQEAGIVLHELDKVGCGVAYGKVAMLPVQLLKPLPNVRDRHRHLLSLVARRTWHLRGRMATEEIYTSVVSGTELSFDYLAFVVVAGLIAAVGLATNSAVMIVASMLVSPLMGPILAFAFGTSVKDSVLIWKGVLVETVGVTLTFLVGFIVGLAVCAWTGVANRFDWPTDEMESRGEVSGMVTGIFFAIPSGAGVALSTTQGGTTALVGVAIAASLLPPIVNTGMCLAFAAVGARRVGMRAGIFYRISWMSFVLFLINVVCIYTVCLLFFWIKGIKKVRKQLSMYKDLPPLPLKPKEQGGSNVFPKHAITSPGALVGYEAQPPAGASGSNGGVSHGPSGGHGPGAAGISGVASAAVPNSGTAGGAATNGEVVIKIGTGAGAANGRDGSARSSLGSRHGSGSAPDARRKGTSGLFGAILHLGSSGLKADGSASGRGSKSKSKAGGSSRTPSRSGFSVRGWRRVRKLVLEDKALDKLKAQEQAQEEKDEEEAKVHNI